ncbi:DUF1016 domain-containing protein [Candidatus Woesearchaeota archaeon]|nr:DUF1016 domain-containing protein [Candidatus Woesearchaeota archaeon]
MKRKNRVILSKTYQHLIESVGSLLIEARKKIYSHINQTLITAYWQIGKYIIEFQQQGKEKATYGSQLLDTLALDLGRKYGKGFSRDNLERMRKFYLLFPKSATLSWKLSWNHYCLLMRVEDKQARQFYIMEADKEKWSVRELDRQINSMLFERLSLSKDKKGVLELAEKGQMVNKAEDIVKDPYVLEFLNVGPSEKYTETSLEEAIINNLNDFLLEFGKGFMFVSQQQRITIEDEHFYLDLVLNNRILRCFVILEIKVGKLTHQDLGQLQMYVNYYNQQVKQQDENPTLGILLCADKKEAIVRYTLPEDNKHIFASKYKLCLPTKEELVQEVRKLI